MAKSLDRIIEIKESLIKEDVFFEMCELCHSESVEKGWWDDWENDPIDFLIEQKILLIYSELFEAFEAIRNNRFTDKQQLRYLFSNDVENTKVYFKTTIKDTFEDEIADVAIRIFDMIGWLKEIEGMYGNLDFRTGDDFKTDFIGFNNILNYLRKRDFRAKEVMYYLERISENDDFDLKAHIYAKMQYNRTRSYRHGNKQF